ncbi:helix-turn-helix domain-containing protein [Flavitalea flava]
MKLEHYHPIAVLQPYIRSYLIIDSDKEVSNTILPDSSLIMAFRYKGKVTILDPEGPAGKEGGQAQKQREVPVILPASVITGLRKTPRIINYAPGTANVLVVFKEGGANAFLRESLHTFFGESLALDSMIPYSEISQIEEQLGEAAGNEERICLIETFLLSRMTLLSGKRSIQPDLLIGEAIQRIKAANGNLSIRDLASAMALSQDPFEKRFRRFTGTSPKQFSTIIRLRHVITHYSKGLSLTSAAYDAGYFDQAHFIKEFKQFTGQTPGVFFAGKEWM